ncbi:MAG: hypothetical protein PVG66_06490 [Chromatiales bacterium]|jgi:hypothetical protein
MKIIVLRVFAAAALLMPLVACDNMDDGPAENAGEKIDEAVEQTSDSVSDAVEETGEKIEEAGDAIEDKTDN